MAMTTPIRRHETWSRILSRDYFPGLAQHLRWLWTPLGTLALVAAISGVCGIVLHSQAFVVLIGIVAVIVVGVAWPWVEVGALRGSLAFERERCREGDSVGVRLRIRNRSPWGAWGVTLSRGFAPSGGSDPAAGERVLGLAHRPGFRTTETRWRFTPVCRGEYPLEAPRFSTGFPFGIREASRPLESSTRLLVWPRTYPVGPIPEASGQVSEGVAMCQHPGTSGDVMGVRPYRRGDSLRRVHWPQTARHGQLVVCELQSHSASKVQVVLDTHAASHAGQGADSSLEWAIRVAASLFEGWTDQGASVELVVQGRAIPAVGGSTAARRARGLDALARVETGGVLTLDDLLEMSECRRFRDGIRVVITTDLGVRSLRKGRSTADRFVVLQASAFGPLGSPAPANLLEVRPWIWIDDATRVPQMLRRAWKEGSSNG